MAEAGAEQIMLGTCNFREIWYNSFIWLELPIDSATYNDRK